MLGVTVEELLNGPSSGQMKITLSYDWSKYQEGGNIDMDENGFELFLGSKGQVGLKGAMPLVNRDSIEEFVSRVREQLEIAFEAQIKRGAIVEG